MSALASCLAVALGGALGASLRYLVVERWLVHLGWRAPFPILAVNLLGCFAVGWLWAFLARSGQPDEGLRLVLIVGLLGGLTTYSAFGNETFALLEQGRVAVAAASVSLHVVGGVVAVWLGRSLA